MLTHLRMQHKDNSIMAWSPDPIYNAPSFAVSLHSRHLLAWTKRFCHIFRTQTELCKVSTSHKKAFCHNCAKLQSLKNHRRRKNSKTFQHSYRNIIVRKFRITEKLFVKIFSNLSETKSFKEGWTENITKRHLSYFSTFWQKQICKSFSIPNKHS